MSSHPHAPHSRPDADTLNSLAGRVLILPDDPLASFAGWRRRLAGFVWRFLGPPLQRQQEFNGLVAHCLTGNIGGDLAAFIETRDRAVQEALSGAISGVADELAKRWESMVAREQRYEARMAVVREMQTALASVQQLSQTLKREMERVLAAEAHRQRGERHAAASGTDAGAVTGDQVPLEGPGPGRRPDATLGPVLHDSGNHVPGTLDAGKYVGFEDQFRGSIDDIRARLADYLPVFAGASDVLEIGCGRGEFLQMLGENGVAARGVDTNHEMVDTCRDLGLDVVEADALDYLASVADESLGGFFAAQVVEHLDPGRLIRLLDVARAKLRPGARMVLETVNPACWAAFFDSYVRDLTHVRPVHPDMLEYLLKASGYQSVAITYRAPYPDHAKLQALPVPAPGPGATTAEWALHDLAETVNANVEKLNARLFTHLDYAALATRP